MARKVTTKSSRKLSGAETERLADQFEAGFDLSAWTPRPGRPRLERLATEDSPRIAVRVPGSLHRRVASLADQEGRTVSELVRGLLEDYVADPDRAR